VPDLDYCVKCKEPWNDRIYYTFRSLKDPSIEDKAWINITINPPVWLEVSTFIGVVTKLAIPPEYPMGTVTIVVPSTLGKVEISPEGDLIFTGTALGTETITFIMCVTPTNCTWFFYTITVLPPGGQGASPSFSNSPSIKPSHHHTSNWFNQTKNNTDWDDDDDDGDDNEDEPLFCTGGQVLLIVGFVFGLHGFVSGNHVWSMFSFFQFIALSAQINVQYPQRWMDYSTCFSWTILEIPYPWEFPNYVVLFEGNKRTLELLFDSSVVSFMNNLFLFLILRPRWTQ